LVALLKKNKTLLKITYLPKNTHSNSKILLLWILIAIVSCKTNNRVQILEKDSAPKNKISFYNKIPEKVILVRDYVRKHHKAMPNYVGGRIFKNLEQRLPKIDQNRQKIRYQEWDVNRKSKGKNRGKERLITGSDNKDYYTKDHYKSFELLPNYKEY
jgi:guanyl-specific ribonuclease Sa